MRNLTNSIETEAESVGAIIAAQKAVTVENITTAVKRVRNFDTAVRPICNMPAKNKSSFCKSNGTRKLRERLFDAG